MNDNILLDFCSFAPAARITPTSRRATTANGATEATTEGPHQRKSVPPEESPAGAQRRACSSSSARAGDVIPLARATAALARTGGCAIATHDQQLPKTQSSPLSSGGGSYQLQQAQFISAGGLKIKTAGSSQVHVGARYSAPGGQTLQLAQGRVSAAPAVVNTGLVASSAAPKIGTPIFSTRRSGQSSFIQMPPAAPSSCRTASNPRSRLLDVQFPKVVNNLRPQPGISPGVAAAVGGTVVADHSVSAAAVTGGERSATASASGEVVNLQSPVIPQRGSSATTTRTLFAATKNYY